MSKQQRAYKNGQQRAHKKEQQKANQNDDRTTSVRKHIFLIGYNTFVRGMLILLG